MKKKRLLSFALAILLTLTALPVSTQAASGTGFPDTQTHWAREAIERWSKLGVLNGFPDGKFHPDDYITACELCKIVNSLVDCFDCFFADSGLCPAGNSN